MKVPYVMVIVHVCVGTHFSAGEIHSGTRPVVPSLPAVLSAAGVVADLVVVVAGVAGQVADDVSVVSHVTGPSLAPLVVVVWGLHG